MPTQPIRWGILGAADFALNHMGPAINQANGATLSGIASSSAEKAAGFINIAPDAKFYDSYEAMLNDPAIDAVYVPLPNHLHVEWTLKALAAGKHVLTEKPIALEASEIDQLIKARDASGLLAAEAYMIAHHPQWARTKELIASGAIGTLMRTDAAFSYNNRDGDNIRNRPETGGGGIRDIGVYTMGSVRLVTGREPLGLHSTRIHMENGIDAFAEVLFDFDGFTHQSFTSMRMANRQSVTFQGDEGVLTLTCPFNSNVFDQAELHLSEPSGVVRVERFSGVNQYVLQVEAFGDTIRNGTPYAWTLEDAKGTQAMLDQVLAQVA